MTHLETTRPRGRATVLLSPASSLTLAFLGFLLVSSGIATAQTQFSVLDTRHLPHIDPNAFHIDSGDIDGDGDLDLAIGSIGSVKILKNDGSGHFTESASLPASNPLVFAAALELGDIDLDGDLDLILFTHRQVYINDGKGNFSASNARLPAYPGSVGDGILVDVDGDKDLDIVLVTTTNAIAVGAQNLLLLNNGKGFYTDVTSTHFPAVKDNAAGVISADIDGDGDLDLYIFAVGLGNIGHDSFYINDGKGKFVVRRGSMDWNGAAAFGDVDGDGDIDLLTGEAIFLFKGLNLYLNDGKGQFTLMLQKRAVSQAA